MAKLSKAKKADVLEKRFPEFYRLSKELSEALECVKMELEDKMEQIEEIESLQEELEDKKSQLEL